MNITELPCNILIIILRKLDLRSLKCMYEACEQIRHMMDEEPTVRECNMSMNTMATAKTFYEPFFKAIASNLFELNLCAVQDLDKQSFLHIMEHLKRLKSLDITYTILPMDVLLDIHKMGLKLTDISVNFDFDQIITVEILLGYQAVFEKCKNVHFVGSKFCLKQKTELALIILDTARLDTLRFSSVHMDFEYPCKRIPEGIYRRTREFPLFSEFTICISDAVEHWFRQTINIPFSKLSVLELLDCQHYEVIIIVQAQYCPYDTFTVYATPLFDDLFKDFDVEAKRITDQHLMGNGIMMLWDKEYVAATSHEALLGKVKKQIRQYLTYTCTSPYVMEAREYDSFCIVVSHENGNTVLETTLETTTSLVLNYDTTFAKKTQIRLHLILSRNIWCPVTLTADCNYLRKLTHLSLTGLVDYTVEFFNVLFGCASNLVTLDLVCPHISMCAYSIADSIASTKSLKNIRLDDVTIIPIKKILSAFSKCVTLENIYIVERFLKSEICEDLLDETKVPFEPSIPMALLENCTNLHSLYIKAFSDFKSRRNLKQIFAESKMKLNKNANIEINFGLCDRLLFPKNPFVQVFNIAPVVYCDS